MDIFGPDNIAAAASQARAALLCTRPEFPWLGLIEDHQRNSHMGDAVIDQYFKRQPQNPQSCVVGSPENGDSGIDQRANTIWAHAPHALAAASHPFARIGLQALLQIYSHDSDNDRVLPKAQLNLDALNAKDHDGKTPLFWAARNGRDLVVRHLLSAGAELDHRTRSSSYTALMAAAAAGHKDIVLMLVRAGACVNVRARGPGITALYLAIQSVRNAAVVEALVEAGGNPNCKQTSSGETPLHLAASRNYHEIVSSLLCLGNADPAIANVEGNTALHFAAERGHSETVDRLLNESGDIQHALHCRDKEGFTALNRAIMGNHLAVIDLLLEAGAAGVPREGSRNLVPSPVGGSRASNSPLYLAAKKGSTEAVMKIVKAGVDVERREPVTGETALHGAASRGKSRTIEVLLTAGIDINSGDYVDGWTPLHHAAWHGHQRAVEVLLQNGAYWDAQGVRDAAVGVEGLGGGGGVDGWGGGEHGGGDGNGGEGGGGDGGGEGDGEEVDMDTRGVHGDRTPLHLASLAGHTGVVDALLLASADADREDTTGRSALVLATDAGHTAVVLALLRWGVSLHCRGEALHAAAGEGRYNLAGFLLQQGAPVNARCAKFGITPLHVACRKTQVYLVDLLLRWGADEHALEDEHYVDSEHGDDGYSLQEGWIEISRKPINVISRGLPPGPVKVRVPRGDATDREEMAGETGGGGGDAEDMDGQGALNILNADDDEADDDDGAESLDIEHESELDSYKVRLWRGDNQHDSEICREIRELVSLVARLAAREKGVFRKLVSYL